MTHFGMNHIGTQCQNGAAAMLSRILSGYRTMSLTPAEGFNITLRNLTCGTALRNLSNEIEEGEIILVESDSKTERSLLFAVIMRLFPFESGILEVGGVPLSEQPLVSLRRNMRLVSADLPLVRGTVEHNIRSASQHLTADDLKSVEILFGLGPSPDGLPHGLKTRVFNGGTNLTAGVRSRVSLARALATTPRILLIDDPAFLTDPGARLSLERTIASRKYTVLIAASLGQRVAGVDRVWRLDE